MRFADTIIHVPDVPASPAGYGCASGFVARFLDLAQPLDVEVALLGDDVAATHGCAQAPAAVERRIPAETACGRSMPLLHYAQGRVVRHCSSETP